VSNKEILEKAIQKAIDGGWNPDQTGFKTVKEVWSWYDLDRRGMKAMLIYSKSFAKALWGEDYIANKKMFANHAWQYHLQNMVIVDNPIKYLGENI